MAVHLTPLKRSQLLDLEALVESVTQPASPSLSSSCLRSPTNGVAAPHHHTSTNGTLMPVHTRPHDSPHSLPSAFTKLEEHPLAMGSFCDVFEDPLTRHAWRTYDKILYFVWWSHRPPSCTECGMHDAWVPSAESEMKCWHCGTGAGSTMVKDIVEDFPTNGAEEDMDGQEDAMSDGGDPEEVNGGMGNGVSAGGGGGGAVALYLFFHDWLAQMRLDEGGKGIVVPNGEGLAAVMRAAYDLSLLFVLPGLPRGGAAVLRGAALYLSLVLHRFPAPFPLFCRAGDRSSASGADAERPPNTRGNHPNHKTSSGSCGGGGVMDDSNEELQWVDVELLADFIGVALSDFFESPRVAVQYLQNVMAVAAEFAVPTVLWHPQRVAGRAEFIQHELRQRRQAQQQRQQQRRKRVGGGEASRISPEHTAMLVALELARIVDTAPCAPQQAERIGTWLDQLGLYPQRRVYPGGGHNNHNSELSRKHPKGGREEKKKEDGNPSTPHTMAADEDTNWWGPPMTTANSIFAADMRLVLLSPCANALLYVFARTFSISALELADMAVSSGIYNGSTRFFEVLRHAAQSGDYTRMPLVRRLSPTTSVWTSTYFALHSEDRLPLLTALQHIRGAMSRDKEIQAARLVQRILRKHHAARRYQFNYTVRVTDESEGHQFKGVYFLSYVTDRVAIFTGIRSGRKTITFDNATGLITLNYIGVHEQQTDVLHVEFNGPVIAHIETESAKSAIDCVRQSTGAESWQAVVHNLDRCGRVRRRMRVPMLASRLDALASVREATAMASHPVVGAATTLLGWGETEAILTSLSSSGALHATTLRNELQHNFLSLPRPSLVLGLSENRVMAIYASLVALLEHMEQQQQQQGRRQRNGWVQTSWPDVLLSSAEEETHRGGGCSPAILPAPTTTNPWSHSNGSGHPHVPSYREVMLGTAWSAPPGRSRPNGPRPRRHVDGSQPICRASEAEWGVMFNLFCAEECRRRLRRMLQFLMTYKANARQQQQTSQSQQQQQQQQSQSQSQQPLQQSQRTPKVTPIRTAVVLGLPIPPPLNLSGGGNRTGGFSPEIRRATPPKAQQTQQRQRRRRVSCSAAPLGSSDESETERGVARKRSRGRDGETSPQVHQQEEERKVHTSLSEASSNGYERSPKRRRRRRG